MCYTIQHTVCLRSFVQFSLYTYYIKTDKTSWTFSRCRHYWVQEYNKPYWIYIILALFLYEKEIWSVKTHFMCAEIVLMQHLLFIYQEGYQFILVTAFKAGKSYITTAVASVISLSILQTFIKTKRLKKKFYIFKITYIFYVGNLNKKFFFSF